MPKLRRMPYSLTACGLIFLSSTWFTVHAFYIFFVYGCMICLSALVNCLSSYLKITPPDK